MLLKTLFVSAVVIAIFALQAVAHPLGNFSINQFSSIEIAHNEISVRQILDMAEIPTFQESARIDTDNDGKLSQEELNAYASSLARSIAADLHLNLNGEPLVLTPMGTRAEIGRGAGDLPTLRIEWRLSAGLPANVEIGHLRFQNDNYKGRAGWNEIVVSRADGISVFDSSAFSSSLSGELRNYPQENIMAPLGERAAELSFSSGPVPSGAKPLSDRDGRIAEGAARDRFAELITAPQITPMVVFVALIAAFGLGAMHAMSPGHGKTVVGAYLVGSRGSLRHAVILGLTVTVTHTIGVFALGLLTLFASDYLLPETMLPFLGFVSGLIVFFIGVTLFKERLFKLFGWGPHHAPDHVHSEVEPGSPHSHGGITHTHGGSSHTHEIPEDLSLKGLLSLGISGGLLPCPSALVLMLSAISLGRVGYGLVLTIMFSVGLASTLTAIGILFLLVGKAVTRTGIAESRIVKVLPAFSSLVVACVGAVICYSSIRSRL